MNWPSFEPIIRYHISYMENRRGSRLQALERPVLAQQAYHAIRAAILALELEPGTQLVEAELANRLSISKSPVREALLRLSAEGLAFQTAYRGVVVAQIDANEVDEIYTVREVLEPLAVRLAVPRLSHEDVAVARAILERSRDAIALADLAELAQVNREYHRFFSTHSGNRLLQTMLSTLQDKVRIASVQGWRLLASMETEHSQHLAVLEAAAKGQAEVAASRMRMHVRAFRLAYRRGANREDH
jgi:DNA-binding GntR family transcriptional regulator